MKLSEHFELSEFLSPDFATVPPLVLSNLKRLAAKLEEVRKELGNKPIIVTSGYRTPEHNRKVGGEKNSFHMRGLAADIVVPGMSPAKVQTILHDWSGGLGSYDSFTHIDIRSYKARWRG